MRALKGSDCPQFLDRRITAGSCLSFPVLVITYFPETCHSPPISNIPPSIIHPASSSTRPPQPPLPTQQCSLHKPCQLGCLVAPCQHGKQIAGYGIRKDVHTPRTNHLLSSRPHVSRPARCCHIHHDAPSK